MMEVINIRKDKNSMSLTAVYPYKGAMRVESLNSNRMKIPKLKPCKTAIKKKLVLANNHTNNTTQKRG